MKNKGRIVSRAKLMDELWQTDEFVDDNALTVNVGRLRKKLDAAGLEGFIDAKFGERLHHRRQFTPGEELINQMAKIKMPGPANAPKIGGSK